MILAISLVRHIGLHKELFVFFLQVLRLHFFFLNQEMVYYRDSQSERPPLSRILPHLYLGAETDVTQVYLQSSNDLSV